MRVILWNQMESVPIIKEHQIFFTINHQKHKNVILEESIITDWYNKYNLLFPNDVFDHKAYKILYS